VDFAPEPPADRITDARAFVPSFGGSQANTAIGAARFGAHAALGGCAGTDPWGQWLREQLVSEGVDVSLFRLRKDVETTHAFVALSPQGEPSFSIFGGAEDGCLAGLEDKLQALVETGPPGVLAFGSDTLIAPADRDLLAAMKATAAGRAWRVLYDPNLRGGRWPDTDHMLAVARAALAHVTVVKANADEAAALTGEPDPAKAAEALVRLGPGQAVVTVGAGGAVLAGDADSIRVPAEPVEIRDATGAGDAVAAVLAAGLGRHEAVTPDLIRVAMRVAARVVAERGALAGLPRGREAKEMLTS
jgi:fructokinase